MSERNWKEIKKTYSNRLTLTKAAAAAPENELIIGPEMCKKTK